MSRIPGTRFLIVSFALLMAIARVSIAQSFEVAAQYRVCRGFAIGRTIFGQAARDWFANTIDDETAIASVAAGYARMVELWRRLRPSAAAA